MKLFLVLLLGSLAAHAKGFSQETKEAEALIKNSAIHSSYHYCVESKLTCRTLVLLKNNSTGAVRPDFYDVFLSSERAVGSTGYFVKDCSTYRAFLDDVFDGVVGITVKFPENQALNITFDADGFPTVHDMTLKRLGTTKYIVADMTYSEDEATIIGTEFDSADKNYSAPVRITYNRIEP